MEHWVHRQSEFGQCEHGVGVPRRFQKPLGALEQRATPEHAPADARPSAHNKRVTATPATLARALLSHRPMRRPLLFLLLALFLGLCAAFVQERPPQERLADVAAELQVRLDVAATELAAQAKDALEKDAVNMDEGHALGEGGLRLFKDTVVTAWTDHAPITDAALDSARAVRRRRGGPPVG